MISVAIRSPLVLLEKMGGALDHAQILRARDQVDEALTGLGGEDGIRVGEAHERRLVPRGEALARRVHLRHPGRVGCDRDDQGELGDTRLGLRIGPRRLIGRHHVGRHVGRGRALDHDADRQVGVALGEVAPGHECLVHLAREEARVHDHQPFDAVGMLGGPAQSDRAAPVLDHHRGVAHVELFEQPRHQLDVTVVRVPLPLGRLVRAAKTRIVGADHAASALHERSAASCDTGRTRSARRGSRPPEDRRPRRGSGAAARPPRRSVARTRNPAVRRSARRVCGRRPPAGEDYLSVGEPPARPVRGLPSVGTSSMCR